MKAENKVFVVTGAGNGIGRELVIQLVKKGAKVAMVDISEEALAKTEALAGKESVSRHLIDITNLGAVEKLPAQVIAIHGQVDALINNAGIIHAFVPVKDLDYKTIERVMNINFYGTVYMTKSFLPYFLERPEAHIANVSSMGGFIPFPGQTIYSASKAAVKIFTEGLYGELKNTNVGVTVIHPGAINTNITSNSGLGKARTEEEMFESASQTTAPEIAAEIILEAIENKEFRKMVGKDAEMLDGFYRKDPQAAVNQIVDQMSKHSH